MKLLYSNAIISPKFHTTRVVSDQNYYLSTIRFDMTYTSNNIKALYKFNNKWQYQLTVTLALSLFDIY